MFKLNICCFCFLVSMGATVFVQPLDLVKNRMQMSGEQFHD